MALCQFGAVTFQARLVDGSWSPDYEEEVVWSDEIVPFTFYNVMWMGGKKPAAIELEAQKVSATLYSDLRTLRDAGAPLTLKAPDINGTTHDLTNMVLQNIRGPKFLAFSTTKTYRMVLQFKASNPMP